jgi:hypothetical protein
VKGLKRWKLFLLLFTVFTLGATMTFMAYSFYSVIDIRSFNISLDIVEGANLGISGDTDKLDFGAIPNGATVEKAILVENYRKEPVKILIMVIGNVSPFIEVSENNFLIAGNESRSVKLIAKPRDAEIGHHFGQAVFYFNRG